MKKTILKTICTLVGVLVLSAASFAQFTGSDKKMTLEYKNADVREVVSSILKNAGVNYAIYPEVQGQIDLSVKNVSIETILENVLAQVDCTYTYAGDLLTVKKRVDSPIVSTDPDDPAVQVPKSTQIVRKIYIRSADPMLIAILLSGTQNYNGSPVPSQLMILGQGSFGGMNGQGGFGNSSNNSSGGFGGMNGQGGFGNSSRGR